jgi:hypothetical protein
MIERIDGKLAPDCDDPDQMAEAARLAQLERTIEPRALELIGAILEQFPDATIAGVRVRGNIEAPAAEDVPVTFAELWQHVLTEQTTHQVTAKLMPSPENKRRAMCADGLVRMVENAMNTPAILKAFAEVARKRKAAEAEAAQRRVPIAAPAIATAGRCVIGIAPAFTAFGPRSGLLGPSPFDDEGADDGDR